LSLCGRQYGSNECDNSGPLCLPKRYFRIAGDMAPTGPLL